MNAAVSAPRTEVRDTAPKIVSFNIPLDRIGEVIRPKGKVINTIQQETGADIAVDDDGVVGTVTIGSVDGMRVEEARAGSCSSSIRRPPNSAPPTPAGS
ncbi:MAG: KH domain-containing protein [Ilumatobacteraceae bacterium]